MQVAQDCLSNFWSLRARVVEGCKGDLETMAKCLKQGFVATGQLAACLFTEHAHEFREVVQGRVVSLYLY